MGQQVSQGARWRDALRCYACRWLSRCVRWGPAGVALTAWQAPSDVRYRHRRRDLLLTSNKNSIPVIVEKVACPRSLGEEKGSQPRFYRAAAGPVAGQ